MFQLTKIFLHNWHRFRSELITVQGSLYLAGHNGSGKSTILDAMQVVLLADLNLIKFNSSAQDRSDRTIDSFVRGKIFQSRWLRPAGAIGYIVLEFSDTESSQQLTLGCCIEASEAKGRNGERGYFLLREGLDTGLFMPGGRVLERGELKKRLRGYRSSVGRYYEIIKEYQEDMLDALGGLNPRFFNLFQRALSFKSIKDVGSFVEQWLLPEQPLELQNLQRVVARLDDLARESDLVEAKLIVLDALSDKRAKYVRNHELREQYELLGMLLGEEVALREVESVRQEQERQQQSLERQSEELEQLEGLLKSNQTQRDELLTSLGSLEVVQQQRALEQEIERLERELQRVRQRRVSIVEGLKKVAKNLEAIDLEALFEGEATGVRDFLALSKGLDVRQLLPTGLGADCQRLLKSSGEARERAQQRAYALEHEAQALRQQAARLQQEIEELKRGGRGRAYPQSVEYLRDRLESQFGTRPAILCELLEIEDVQWQTAVEAMLGDRRFLIVVAPRHYEEVMSYLEREKGNARLHDASVLDQEKAYQQRRTALPHSLAEQVQVEDSYLRAYVHSVLGNIMTCQRGEEVRNYRRAITPSLFYYNEWAARVIAPEPFQRWVIGQRAQRSQIEARERELEGLGEALARLNEPLLQARADAERLDLHGQLIEISLKLDEPLDDEALQAELLEQRAAYEALDLRGAEALKASIALLSRQMEASEKQRSKLLGELGGLRQALQELGVRQRAAEQARLERTSERQELGARYSEACEIAARALFEEQRRESEIIVALANAERSYKSYSTQAENALREHDSLGTTYNIQYQFAGLPSSPLDPRYSAERERLRSTDLPQYRARIAEARQDAEHELREHVLHILRERIDFTKRELQRMNEALRPLDFHGDRYRFVWEVAHDREEYYRLIWDSQVIGTGALFESEFYQEHQETFERFYREVTSPPTSALASGEQKRFTDYRTYLAYDIEVLHSNGDSSRLSKIMGQNSGGEAQTPFYVTIAASFVQLYHLTAGKQRRQAHERPTLCLAVFDEAFATMDQERIGATLEMFKTYGLQIITATPLERCEYLVPKMATNLVLTAVGDGVLVEEYRNYAAQLEAIEVKGGV